MLALARTGAWTAALLTVAALVLPLVASATTVDFGTVGTFRSSVFDQPGLRLTPGVGVPLASFITYNGVGVIGGLGDSTLDPDESLLFSFATPVTGVSTFVQYGQDADADGQFGEVWVEGYGADGKLLAVGTTAGVGTRDISGLFGGVPLSAFRVHTRDGDRSRIQRVTFNPGGGSQTVDFGTVGTFRSSVFDQSGLRLTAGVGVPLASFITYNGVGVIGGLGDSTLDPDESLLFSFASPVTGVSTFVQYGQDQDADGQFGEVWVEGYGADGKLLAVGTAAGVGTRDISGLFGSVPLSAFRVHTRDGDRSRIQRVSFDWVLDVEPRALSRPATLLLAGPNPLRYEGALAYELPRCGDVDLSLYDLHGRHVRQIVHGQHPAGSFRTSFDARDLDAGVYFALLRVDGETQGRIKLSVIR